MKTLHVTASRSASNPHELSLLLEAQPAETCVCSLDWRRWVDPRPLWQLAASIREYQPAVIAAWGMKALSAVVLVAPKRQATLVVRKPMPSDRRHGTLSRFEAWLLGRADRVLAANDTEAQSCMRSGVSASKVRIVRPGVRSLDLAVEPRDPHIVCAGPFERFSGFYEAIWVFDILHFADGETRLTIAGEGKQRCRLEEFVARAQLGGQIQLPGPVNPIESLLSQATLVWVPSLSDSGSGIALVAMATGLPVIASRWPGLADTIVDGETGFLVEPGSKIEWAQKTRLLLSDANLRHGMGEAGRRRARSHFSSASFVENWNQTCYERVAA